VFEHKHTDVTKKKHSDSFIATASLIQDDAEIAELAEVTKEISANKEKFEKEVGKQANDVRRFHAFCSDTLEAMYLLLVLF
jgi:hypothetical protein